MKLKVLVVTAALTLVGCGEPIDKLAFSGSVLNAICDGPNCYLVVSGLDEWGIRRNREYPTCEDYRKLTGEKVMVFQRVKDNRICWVAYPNK